MLSAKIASVYFLGAVIQFCNWIFIEKEEKIKKRLGYLLYFIIVY